MSSSSGRVTTGSIVARDGSRHAEEDAALRRACRGRARSWSTSPAGRCRSPTRASAPSTCGAELVRDLRRLPHGRDRGRGPAGGRASCSACSPTTSRRSQVGGAQYSCLCREDGGVLDDLFTYRLGGRSLPDGHQRGQPRARPRLVRGARGRVRGRGPRPDRPPTRCSPSRARRRARSWARLADGELPARFRTAELAIAGAPALVCGTGYTGEDGVELLIAPEGAPDRLGRR